MHDSDSFFETFLGKLVVVWMSFNFLILMMKLNDLDHQGNFAWDIFLNPIWIFDKFLFWLAVGVLAAFILYHVVAFLYEALPSTKRKRKEALEAIEFEKLKKQREENDRVYEYNRKREQERIMAEARQLINPAKAEVALDKQLIKKIVPKTKEEVKNELLNSLKGRGK